MFDDDDPWWSDSRKLDGAYTAASLGWRIASGLASFTARVISGMTRLAFRLMRSYLRI